MAERSVEEIAAARAEPRFAADLEALVVAASELTPHPDNARRGDIPAIADSLARFGQVRPVLVQRSTGRVVAGNHVYLAATEALGWDRVAAVRQEMTDEEAKAYLVADNRIPELGSYDQDALASLILSVRSDGLEGTGYNDSEVDALLRSLAPEPPGWQRIDPDAMGGDEYQCPSCGYEWSGKPRSERVGEHANGGEG